VVLLPDALFFTHIVAVSDDGSGGIPGGIAQQVELALEGLSPFLLTQLYYGYFWEPGSPRALVFAAYRRRFTTEQTAAWQGAEAVIPSFAALLGGSPEPGATVVLAAPEGLTAIHWGGGRVPDQVKFVPLAPGAAEGERAAIRTELLRSIGGSVGVVDLSAPPEVQGSRGGAEVVFRCGEFESRLPAAVAAALDVRDKADLAALRRANARDTLFWRVAACCVLLFGLLAVGEAALFAGGFWQKALKLKANAQAPTVAKIETAQNLAHRIDELSTKRLLPLEMISIISAGKPASVQFLRAFTGDRSLLTVEAQTTNPGDISVYQNFLNSIPECARVEIRDQRTRNNIASFTLAITFKPDSVKPAVPLK
jgi:hypothetical protein